MANSVTVRDVAQAAQVSVATVSRVLNNHANIKQGVRQRVLEAAATLGYANGNAATTEGRAKTIKELAFIYSSSIDTHSATANPFWSHILAGAEREAKKANLKLTYRSVGELVGTPQLLLNTLRDMRVGGILLVGPAEIETIRLVQSANLPMVLIDNYFPGLSIDTVLSDNFEGARLAVQHLIELGHRQIAFIGGPLLTDSSRPTNKIYTIERRAAGYRTALLDAGLKLDYDLYEAATLNPEGGYAACQRLLARPAKFSALFCANDEVTIGAMKALREAGLNVPEDRSVMGFDDIEMAQHYNPALTTIRVNKEAMGATAVKALIARASDPDAASLTYMLQVELIERASAKKPVNPS